MEWIDLKQLDTLIQQTKALGADVEEIGVSGEGRSIYAVTVGDKQASRTVVIVAGFHAAEVMSMSNRLCQVSKAIGKDDRQTQWQSG
ncbi:hypothetical protein H6F87_03025 [Cyanobacteria bacterium FACHB-502]|nr:hypothetical protein [Cyanobacteria bacterium FACHB-502]